MNYQSLLITDDPERCPACHGRWQSAVTPGWLCPSCHTAWVPDPWKPDPHVEESLPFYRPIDIDSHDEHRGDWNTLASYTAGDRVRHDNADWIAIRLITSFDYNPRPDLTPEGQRCLLQLPADWDELVAAADHIPIAPPGPRSRPSTLSAPQ